MKRRGALAAVVALAVLLSAASADAQQPRRQRRGARDAGTIEGHVLDAESGEPLGGAEVMVEGTSLRVLTSDGGSYVIVGVPAGDHDLTASMLGYRSVSKEVEVQARATTTVDFELRVSPVEMDAIVVTGTRTPAHVKAAAVRTEVITAETIEEKGARNLYEALQGAPGIRVEQRCACCNYSTVRMQGLESGHTQILIDGQPIFSDLASIYGLQQIPAASIERIEVVKGAGSALYGSSAIAGVINIITRTPTTEPRLQVDASFGTANTNSYNMSASRRLGSVDAVVTAQKNTAGEIDEDGDGFTDRVESDNLALGVSLNAYDLLGDDRFSLHARTLDAFRRGGGLDTWNNAFAESAEHITTDRREAGFRYWKRLHGTGEFSFNFVHAFHRRSATNDAYRSDYESIHGEPPPLDEMRPYVANEHLYVLNGNYSRLLGGGHRLLVGFQYTRNELTETGRYITVDPEDPSYGETYASESDKHADDFGLYLQDDISLTDAVEVVLGARYDTHRSTDEFGGSGTVAPQGRLEFDYDEQAFSPRLAVRFKASSNLTLRGSLGTGFRVPYGFSEDLHLCSGSPRIYKPADLKPEQSTSVNLSADYSTPTLALSANLFRTNLRDKIGFADAGEMSEQMGYTYEWRNIGDAFTQGVELGIRAALRRDLVADFSAAFTDARYEDERSDWASSHPEYAERSKYIPRVPRITGGFGFEYAPDCWNVSLDVDYTGRQYIDYCQDEDMLLPGSKIVHTPDFFVVGSRVSRDVAGGLSIFAGVHNLLDRVQEERHHDDAAFIYAPYTGRIVYGGVDLDLY